MDDLKRRLLSDWARQADDDTSTPDGHVPPPTLVEAVYSPPNPGGDGKRCGNCFLYSGGDRRCVILQMAAGAVGPDMVCNYHVYTAAPKRQWPVERLGALPGETAGLQYAGPAGTSCDRCRYYAAEEGAADGECVANQDGFGGLPRVQAKGCCARWVEAGREG